MGSFLAARHMLRGSHAGVFEAFSRVPLAFQLVDRKPRASEVPRLFKSAVRALGQLRYLITEIGREFTAKVSRSLKTVARRSRGGSLSSARREL